MAEQPNERRTIVLRSERQTSALLAECDSLGVGCYMTAEACEDYHEFELVGSAEAVAKLAKKFGKKS